MIKKLQTLNRITEVGVVGNLIAGAKTGNNDILSKYMQL